MMSKFRLMKDTNNGYTFMRKSHDSILDKLVVFITEQ